MLSVTYIISHFLTIVNKRRRFGDMNVEKIKELMEQKGIKKGELAMAIGVSGAFVTYILSGFKTPSVPVLKRMADYLGVSADELI